MAVTLSDQFLGCADCETEFIFTIAEQLFYAERGIERPSCCPDCRARKRSERNADAIRASDVGGTMLWSDGYGNYGGSAPVGPKKGARTGVRMYSTTCSSCNRPTEVPFEPRNGRPVYCRECFNAKRGK